MRGWPKTIAILSLWLNMAKPQNCFEQLAASNLNPCITMNEAEQAIKAPLKRGNGFKDLTGLPFGDLTVIEYAKTEKGTAFWKCRCACDNIVIARGGNLNSGNTTACRPCGRIKTGNRKRTHGMSETKFYGVWQAMLNRCRNHNQNCAERYVGRGIKVCERWRTFENFRDDMFATYKEGLCIERGDNDGNYEPGNCRWATQEEEANNRSTNRWLTINGQTKTLAQWSRASGTPYQRISDRLSRGWKPEHAIQ